MRRRWAAGWLVVAAGMLGGAAGAGAQTRIDPGKTPTPPPPGELRKHIQEVRTEAEDVRDVPVEDPGTRIRPPGEVQPARERGLPPPEPTVDRPATVPEVTGKAKTALVRTPDYKQRLADLSRCRLEVAFDRKVKPAEVPARGVTLRWTVGPDGRAQDVEVVATAPTEPDVMTCVHKKVSAWDISPAPADPYRVSHALKFK